MSAAASPVRVLGNPSATSAAEGTAAVSNHDAGKGQQSADDLRWRPVLNLPCELLVDLPLPEFKVEDLLKLRPGTVINAHWGVRRDVPLHLNGTLIGWGEFEVMNNRLAVRLTEVA